MLKKETALCLLHHLEQAGIAACIAGGAARDLYHGNEPKDFDIVLLCPVDEDDLVHALKRLCIPVKQFGSGCDTVSMNSATEERLDYVVKANLLGTECDIISLRAQPTTPQEAVELFDCTLNMAWLNKDGAIILHPDFPTEGGAVRMTDICDDPIGRMQYLSSKYPTYQWPTVASLMSHPNALQESTI